MVELVKKDIPILFKGYRILPMREQHFQAYESYRRILNKETDDFAPLLEKCVFDMLLEDYGNNPARRIFLVWKGQEVVGEIYISDLHPKQEAFVNFLAVRKEHRGIGIAEALLGIAEDLAKKAYCKSIGLSVEKNTPELTKYYRRFGFNQTPLKTEVIHMVKPIQDHRQKVWFRERVM